MKGRAGRDTDGIGVENLFNRGQALPLDRDFLRRRKGGFQRNVQCLAGECLQHLAKDDGVGPAGTDEFQLLRREGGGNVDQFFVAAFIEKFPVL